MSIDARLAFYLKHQREIDEWASLRTKACDVSNEFFAGLLPRLREASKGLEGAEVYDGRTGRGWQGLGLYAERWPPGPFGRLAVVAVEWKLAETTFTRGLLGLRIDIDAGGRPLHDAICALMAERVPELPPSGRQTKWYPYQLRTSAHRDDYWTDLDGFAEKLVADMVSVWRALAPLVDEALERAPVWV